MNIPTLTIRSQMGRIAMQSTGSRQQLSQPKADVSIEQPSARMRIHTDKPSLHIDQTEAFADAGLKSVKRMMAEYAQQGYQAFLQGTGRRVAQGSALMRIENGGNAIAQQAETNAYRSTKEIGLEYIPSPFSVQMSYDPGDIDIQVTQQKPRIDAMERPPQIEHVRGDLSIYMAQDPSLEIDVKPMFYERV